MSLAIVTGASSGIGAELAKLLAADHHDLVLVARREDRLRALAEELSHRHGVSADVVAIDLADPDAPAELVRRVDGAEVDVLVNNAGFGLLARFSAGAWQDYAEMLRVNVVALTELTHSLLAGMVARGSGRILNVASTAAFQPGPGMAVYYASKAYVLSFSEALAVELAGTGVSVTALCPGVTDTGFQQRAHAEGILLTRAMRMPADVVARAGYHGMREGKSLVIPGATNKVGVQMLRVGPRWLVPRIVARLHSL